MRRILRFALVLAPLAAAAPACGGGGDDDDDGSTPTTGSIVLTASCAGPACGLTGTLRIPVRESACTNPVLLTVTVPAVTTSAASPIVHTLTLERDFWCVEAFLDVDQDGALSTGDAVSSTPPGVAQAGPGTPVGILLDSLEP